MTQCKWGICCVGKVLLYLSSLTSSQDEYFLICLTYNGPSVLAKYGVTTIILFLLEFFLTHAIWCSTHIGLLYILFIMDLQPFYTGTLNYWCWYNVLCVIQSVFSCSFCILSEGTSICFASFTEGTSICFASFTEGYKW